MHLFETEEGDKWVCIACGQEERKAIEDKGWEYIFDRDDPELRCVLCGNGDFEYED